MNAPQNLLAGRQWRVTFHEAGEMPEEELMRSFQDAWAIAQPYPEEDGLAWQFEQRAFIRASFELAVEDPNQPRTLRVCWVDDDTYTTIEMI